MLPSIFALNATVSDRFGFDLIYGGDSEQVKVWNDVGVPALGKAFAGRSGRRR